MLTVPYPEVARVLESGAAELPPAEGHGCLCGALCVSRGYSLRDWLAELGLDQEPASTPAESLQVVYDDTVRTLSAEPETFRPLLPDDDTALAARTEALAQWCQGFLYGFATAAGEAPAALADEAAEVLVDFAEIGRAAVDDPQPDPGADEQDEAAYAELYEFVRVGVQLIHEELGDFRRQGV